MSTFFQATTRTQITGLTAATWVRNINVGSFVPVPTGAKHVVIEIYHNSGTNAAYGFQKSGTTPDNIFATTNRFKRLEFINIEGSSLIDLYAGNTTFVQFFIVGYTSHVTDVTPIDFTSQVTTPLATNTVTLSALPDEAAGGVAVVRVNRVIASFHAVGDTTIRRWYHLERQIELVPLDSLKRFIVDPGAVPTANSLFVVGWMPAGSVVWSSDRAPRSVSTINTWQLQTWIDSNPISFFQTNDTVSSTLAGIEAGGFSDVGARGQATARKSGQWFSQPDSNGQFSIRASAVTAQFYHWGSIVANLASAAISGIDQLIAGQTTAIDFTDDFTGTSVTISDGIYSFVISSGITQVTPTRISFVCPSPQDETVGARAGSVSVTVSDGSNATPDFTAIYSVANHTAVELLSVDVENYAAGRTPALEVGSQVLYPDVRCTVSDSGVFETEETGTTILVYDRSPSDGKWRFVYLETGSPTPPEPGNTTSLKRSLKSSLKQVLKSPL